VARYRPTSLPYVPQAARPARATIRYDVLHTNSNEAVELAHRRAG